MRETLSRREFLKIAGLATAGVAVPGCTQALRASADSNTNRRPNFVVIFIDDMGYADVGCFGAEGYETPNVDRLAAEGVRFTDFYAAASSCTPSRAALMTGCYPQRVGLPYVLGPNSKIGISDGETTIAQMLKPLGYATACYGKWHLGDDPQFLPTRHGFDEYFGLPYSNDMWPKHPEAPNAYPDLPLIEGERVVAYDPDQTQLTTWYTERAVRFIEKNKDNPFFLYLPHSMVHVPLHVSDKFKGQSKRGLFGDVVMEIDWSVGQIVSTLRRLGLDKDTMVLFCSDNGPWLSYGDHAGSAGPPPRGTKAPPTTAASENPRSSGGLVESRVDASAKSLCPRWTCCPPSPGSQARTCPAIRSMARTSGRSSWPSRERRAHTTRSSTIRVGLSKRSAAASGSCTSRTDTARWAAVPAGQAASQPSTSRRRPNWRSTTCLPISASSTMSLTNIRTSWNGSRNSRTRCARILATLQ